MKPAARPLALAAPFAVLLVSCGGAEAPEPLPLIEEITTTSAAPAPATTIDLDAPAGEVTDAQQAMLDVCAEAIERATAELDPTDPGFADEVMTAILGEGSDAMNACGPVMEPESGISQDVLITFMLEQLPPELLGALGEAASSGDLGAAGAGIPTALRPPRTPPTERPAPPVTPGRASLRRRNAGPGARPVPDRRDG